MKNSSLFFLKWRICGILVHSYVLTNTAEWGQLKYTRRTPWESH